jgi:hypothetical protein
MDCKFILEKELSQLTPVTQPSTMYSKNKTAIATANQHTVAMLTARVRTPLGSLDPNSLYGTLRQHQMLLYKSISILIHSYTNCSSLQSPSPLQSRMRQ